MRGTKAMSVQATVAVTPAIVERERLATLPDVSSRPLGIAAVLRRGFDYWRPYWLLAIPIVVTMFIQEGFITFFDLNLQRIIDNVLVDKDGELLVQILAELAGAYVLASIAGVLGNYRTARTGAGILNDLRRRMFAHLQRLSMDYFAHARSGDVIARFTSDLAEIEKGLTYRFTDGHLSLIGLLLNLPTLFILQWQLALATLAALPLVLLGSRLFTPRASRSYLRLKREQAALASAIHENLKAQAIIRIFGLQRSTLTRLDRQLADLYHCTSKATFLSMLVGTSSSFGVRLVQLLVIAMGAYLAFSGSISVGTLVAFVALLADVSTDAYNLSKKVAPSLIAAGGGVQRIEELLNEQPRVTDAPKAGPLPRLASAIRFEDVSFSYTGNQPTLEHVSLTIPAGQFVAFVGPTGAGKSTILGLIGRFYDVASGTVTFDGHDLRGVTQDSLRAQMGAVFQDTFLFDTTIRENIRMGKLDARDDEIEAAARAAEIHDLIADLPDGYDTRTGELGALLSGGQRQRLAIARAILRDPAILILDEPTSDLDPATEAAINATITRLAKNRTVIAVTHRLSSVQHADRIFVLDRGHVVLQGRHEDLIGTQGLYDQLWQSQR
jgi:ATP-binding cassette, subfamily B, bacterial